MVNKQFKNNKDVDRKDEELIDAVFSKIDDDHDY